MIHLSILNIAAGLIAGPICLVALYILFQPPLDDIMYRLRIWYKRRAGVEVAMPATHYFFPFGIPILIKVLRAQASKRFYGFFQQLNNDKSQQRLTVRLQSLGNFSIMTMDPENVKTVLSVNFKDYSLGDRYGAFFDLLGDGIFTLDGQGWQHSRTMLRPQFTRQQISHLDTIEVHTAKLLAILRQHSTVPVDLQKLFFQLTIDTATGFLFGESVEMLSGGNPRIANAREFGRAFNSAQLVLSQRIQFQAFYNLYRPAEFVKDCETCKTFTDSFVQIALKKREQNLLLKEKPPAKYVFLDELAKETQNPTILRDQSLNILLAGRDTTASLLSWVFYNLALHKPYFYKLREEVLQMFGPGPTLSEKHDDSSLKAITFESLKQCTYLKHVINEALRLYPTVPGNRRTAIRDTYLPHGGADPRAPPRSLDESLPVLVPKGTNVVYSVYVMHRHPKLWGPDADSFNPDRWARDSAAARPNAHPWDFLPFNGGPRICLGQQFALNEASYVIVRLLQTFKDIAPSPTQVFSQRPLEDAQLTMNVEGGVNLTFVPA